MGDPVDDSADEVFFAEWQRRRPGERRDVARAGAVARELGITAPRRRVVAVVGSKGKGTAATYASACLAAHGRRVVTVTGPALRRNAERIRVNGRAVSDATLRELGGRLRTAIGRVRRRGGYLSPAGLFLLAGVLHAERERADVLVLEAGMGGRSDEISLFPPDVLAIGTIFAEHIGVLGDDVVEIAREKASVVAAGTHAVLSLPQRAAVAAEIARVVAERTGDAVTPVVARPDSDGLPAGIRPDGFNAANAGLGYRAGIAAAGLLGGEPPPAARLDAVLRSVTLPGRLSWHQVPGAEVLVDSAISRPGIAAALAAARHRWGSVDRVLVCLPDHKDLDGAVAELAGTPVTFVRLPGTHLRFRRALPADWEVIDLTGLRLSAYGPRVVALGTVYFTGRVLDLLGAGTERLFSVGAGDDGA